MTPNDIIKSYKIGPLMINHLHVIIIDVTFAIHKSINEYIKTEAI